jgi:hypothetical protein
MNRLPQYELICIHTIVITPYFFRRHKHLETPHIYFFNNYFYVCILACREILQYTLRSFIILTLLTKATLTYYYFLYRVVIFEFSHWCCEIKRMKIVVKKLLLKIGLLFLNLVNTLTGIIWKFYLCIESEKI